MYNEGASRRKGDPFRTTRLRRNKKKTQKIGKEKKIASRFFSLRALTRRGKGPGTAAPSGPPGAAPSSRTRQASRRQRASSSSPPPGWRRRRHARWPARRHARRQGQYDGDPLRSRDESPNPRFRARSSVHARGARVERRNGQELWIEG